MSSSHSVFGDANIQITGKNPKILAASAALKNVKYTMLYFSAQWCPPCRAFTPVLSKWYSEHLALDMDIVYVSSDNSERDFNDYYSKMPWLAIPYENRDLVQDLINTYDITGFPTLIIVDNATGLAVCRDARTMVQTNMGGFPWV
jgi:nucleoredoxin